MIYIKEPLIGGLIIGLASSLFLFLSGRVAGISGIFGGLIDKPRSGDSLWRATFILGLICGGFFMKVSFPDFFNYEFKFSNLELILGGVLVGIGTRLGSGCTSGHGVCGLPRFSLRSLVATLVFMIAGVLTVFLKGL